MAEPPPELSACHCCGLILELPAVPAGSVASCPRCRATVKSARRHPASNGGTIAAALAALILYPLAISLPIMNIERFGHMRAASVWTGAWELVFDGHIWVGLVVLLCSIAIPMLKLVGLLSITLGRKLIARRHRAFTYRLIEWTGRWGMLDVLLIAIVVAWIKVGDLVDVTPGPASWTFTIVVLLSLLASAWFDPHALWADEQLPEPKPDTRP